MTASYSAHFSSFQDHIPACNDLLRKQRIWYPVSRASVSYGPLRPKGSQQTEARIGQVGHTSDDVFSGNA